MMAATPIACLQHSLILLSAPRRFRAALLICGHLELVCDEVGRNLYVALR
jgi:hypothetical protein